MFTTIRYLKFDATRLQRERHKTFAGNVGLVRQINVFQSLEYANLDHGKRARAHKTCLLRTERAEKGKANKVAW